MSYLFHHSAKLWFFDVVEELSADSGVEKVANTVHDLSHGIQVFSFALKVG